MQMKPLISEAVTHISNPDVEGITRSTRALFVAILTRALKDIFKPTYGGYDFYKMQALTWIEVNDFESFTSFVNICSNLDLNAERVRRCVYSKLSTIELGCKPSVSVTSIVDGHCQGKRGEQECDGRHMDT